ncbi:MAG: chemotaxis-specific protein-glutamate methyltransferase CheB [Myxococcota bacterium]
MAGRTRILIVDDSAICRAALRGVLERESDFEVVGEAEDGLEATQMVEALRPSLVTMDLQMPRMGGLEAIDWIMRHRPTPVLVVTDRPRVDGVDMTFAALSVGALDLVTKPTSWTHGGTTPADLVARVRNLVRVRMGVGEAVPRTRTPAPLPTPTGREKGWKPALVGIGASTGGPKAIAEVLSHLPADFPLPVVLVQHIDAQFQESFVHWLGKQTPLVVRMAEHRQPLHAGEVSIAPAKVELEVREGFLRLVAATPEAFHVPSVDRLFHTMAASYGARSVGVLLTGMGVDGAEGLKALHDAGAVTIAQDEKTSAVYGMPMAAVERNAVDLVLPLSEIAPTLRAYARADAEEAVSLPVRSKRRRILVVDDSQVVLSTTRLALESAGFEVLALDNPLGVAKVVRVEQPDLLLLDVSMPVVTGDVVAKIVRQHGVAPSIPVLLFSDLPEPELKARAESCGANGYIQKSGGREVLLKEVHAHLGTAGEASSVSASRRGT